MRKKTAFGHYLSGVDLTVSALSKKAGTSRPPIIALVVGKSKGMQFSTMEKLCAALHISIDTLVKLANTEPTAWPDEWVKELIEQAEQSNSHHPEGTNRESDSL